MRLYHNPRCSKSRQALSLLNDREIEFEEYRYLDKGIDHNDLQILFGVQGIIRMNDLQENGIINFSNFDEFKSLLQSRPEVLQRPVLIHNGLAVIGRPPEDILTLLP